MLTLSQALKTSTYDKRTIKRWYAQGYYLRDDGRWYMSIGGREMPKIGRAHV